jgi:hypothetical protein
MNADQIEQIVNEITELKKTKTKEELDTIYTEFRTKNKLLYETVLSGEMDNFVFKQMMSMKRKLEAGEDQYSVDVKFGQFMSERYIDPVIKKA